MTEPYLPISPCEGCEDSHKGLNGTCKSTVPCEPLFNYQDQLAALENTLELLIAKYASEGIDWRGEIQSILAKIKEAKG